MTLTLYVRWHARGGRSRVHALPLRPVPSIDALQGVPRSLLDRAFVGGAAARPPHLASDDFYRFTPTAECLSLPPDVARTEFRLTAAPSAPEAGGWEYGLLRRDLGPVVDPSKNDMLVTVVEFESAALVAGALGVRLAMVAYPVVCVRRVFLDDACARLESDPDAFTGVL